jgi:hypothetical protein
MSSVADELDVRFVMGMHNKMTYANSEMNGYILI